MRKAVLSPIPGRPRRAACALPIVADDVVFIRNASLVFGFVALMRLNRELYVTHLVMNWDVSNDMDMFLRRVVWKLKQRASDIHIRIGVGQELVSRYLTQHGFVQLSDTHHLVLRPMAIGGETAKRRRVVTAKELSPEKLVILPPNLITTEILSYVPMRFHTSTWHTNIRTNWSDAGTQYIEKYEEVTPRLFYGYFQRDPSKRAYFLYLSLYITGYSGIIRKSPYIYSVLTKLTMCSITSTFVGSPSELRMPVSGDSDCRRLRSMRNMRTLSMVIYLPDQAELASILPAHRPLLPNLRKLHISVVPTNRYLDSVKKGARRDMLRAWRKQWIWKAEDRALALHRPLASLHKMSISRVNDDSLLELISTVAPQLTHLSLRWCVCHGEAPPIILSRIQCLSCICGPMVNYHVGKYIARNSPLLRSLRMVQDGQTGGHLKKIAPLFMGHYTLNLPLLAHLSVDDLNDIIMIDPSSLPNIARIFIGTHFPVESVQSFLWSFPVDSYFLRVWNSRAGSLSSPGIRVPDKFVYLVEPEQRKIRDIKRDMVEAAKENERNIALFGPDFMKIHGLKHRWRVIRPSVEDEDLHEKIKLLRARIKMRECDVW